MSCDNVQELISLLIDQKVVAGEREKVLAHLESCKPCSSQFESMLKVRAALRSMNDVTMPAVLGSKLRVIASHEHARRLRLASGRYWSDGVKLWFDNLLRPVFMPLAGGVLSAAIIFCVLVPTLSFQSIEAALTADGQVVSGGREATMVGTVVLDSGSAYAPIGGDSPKIQPVYSESPDDANIAWLAIDENGKVTGCSVTKGRLTPDMQNVIMSSRFAPPTFLGVRTAGLVQMVQRRTHVRRAVRS